MNMYTIVPNPDMSGWMVKLEDVAPEEQYLSEDEAIAAAEEMAKENKPSIIQVLNKEHEVVDEKKFQ